MKEINIVSPTSEIHKRTEGKTPSIQLTPPYKDLKNTGLVTRKLHFIQSDYLNVPIWKCKDFQLEYLDQGFFGVIYKATHCVSKEVLVLKELQSDEHQIINEDDVKQFYDEITLLSKLNHPNIIKFKGVLFREDNICFLSEYVGGGNLQQLLHKQKELKLPWKMYLNITLDVARGMAYLHAKHIIHRDLHSKNILMRQISCTRYQAVIIDLGLSYQKPEVHSPEEEAPSGPVGSPFHIAPELFNMDPCSKKADVFSYGIILCEIISGCPGADPDELPRRNDYGLNVEEFNKIALDCPAEFLNLAVRCCQVNPKLRPKFNDIVKVIDIIIDRCEEEEEETQDVDSQTDPDPSENQVTADDFFIEGSLLCSCRVQGVKRRSQTFSEGFFKTAYDRFGEIQRTSSRRHLRTHFRRCSMCGGRILSFEEKKRRSSVTNFDENISLVNSKTNCVPHAPESPSDSVNKDVDKNCVHMEENENSFQKNEKYDLDGAIVDSDNEKISGINDITSDTGTERNSNIVGIIVTKTSPISIPEPALVNNEDGEGGEEKEERKSSVGFLLESPRGSNYSSRTSDFYTYSYLENSINYAAATMLMQNKTEISSKTSQLAQNTPGKLPRFFQNILRRRKSRVTLTNIDERSSSDRRSVRTSLNKFFHFSSIEKTNESSPNQQSTNGSYTPKHTGVTRRCLVNEISDYESRRRSMPVFLRSYRGHNEPRLRRPLSPGSVSLEDKERPILRQTLSSDSEVSRVQCDPQKTKRSRSFMDLLLRRK